MMAAAYTAVVAAGLALAIALLLAEPERNQPKHRRPRPTASEARAMFRHILETAAVMSGIAIVAAFLGFGLLVRGLHWLDARRERAFWGGRPVHS